MYPWVEQAHARSALDEMCLGVWPERCHHGSPLSHCRVRGRKLMQKCCLTHFRCCRARITGFGPRGNVCMQPAGSQNHHRERARQYESLAVTVVPWHLRPRDPARRRIIVSSTPSVPGEHLSVLVHLSTPTGIRVRGRIVEPQMRPRLPFILEPGPALHFGPCRIISEHSQPHEIVEQSLTIVLLPCMPRRCIWRNLTYDTLDGHTAF
jgi:hypothetical protein